MLVDFGTSQKTSQPSEGPVGTAGLARRLQILRGVKEVWGLGFGVGA